MRKLAVLMLVLSTVLYGQDKKQKVVSSDTTLSRVEMIQNIDRQIEQMQEYAKALQAQRQLLSAITADSLKVKK